MKTLNFILIMTVLTLSTNINAKPVSVIKNAKSLIVETSGWKSEKVQVQIKDLSGAIILDEVLGKSTSARKYNLINLPDGQYSIEMSSDLKITTRNFEVTGKEINLSADIQTFYKPVVIWTDQTLDINLLTLGKRAVINIVDGKNNTILSQKHDTAALHKRYNISALPEGDYTVNVEMNGRSFYFNYTK